jgi:hypothetical protein
LDWAISSCDARRQGRRGECNATLLCAQYLLEQGNLVLTLRDIAWASDCSVVEELWFNRHPPFSSMVVKIGAGRRLEKTVQPPA